MLEEERDDHIADYTPAVRQGSRVKVVNRRYKGISTNGNSQSQRLFHNHLQNRHRMEGAFEPNLRDEGFPSNRWTEDSVQQAVRDEIDDVAQTEKLSEYFAHAFMASVVYLPEGTPRRSNPGTSPPRDENIPEPVNIVPTESSVEEATLTEIPMVPFMILAPRIRISQYHW